MNNSLKHRINKYLGEHGIAQIEDAPQLLMQLGFLVRSHEHLRQLLVACDPDNRAAMYDSLTPNLRFKAKPLDAYIAESGQQAESRQLPTVGPCGTFAPFRVPEVKTKKESKE